jgi:hypothetical protein
MAEMEAALVRAPGRPLAESDAALDARAADLAGALQKLIGRTSNAESLAELLALNDGVAERRAGRWTRPPRAGLGLNLGALAPVDEGMLTPGGSKGKGRAVPEPEVFEPVTTPTFVLASDDEAAHGLGAALDSDSEAESAGEGEGVDQGVRSRTWVAEEGEVFRKGQALLGPEELEGDYDSEDLRQQVRVLVCPHTACSLIAAARRGDRPAAAAPDRRRGRVRDRRGGRERGLAAARDADDAHGRRARPKAVRPASAVVAGEHDVGQLGGLGGDGEDVMYYGVCYGYGGNRAGKRAYRAGKRTCRAQSSVRSMTVRRRFGARSSSRFGVLPLFRRRAISACGAGSVWERG